MRSCSQDQTVEPGALAPTAIALLEYLVRRQSPPKAEDMANVSVAVDEWLIEARAARSRFRKLATPALRSTRSRAAAGVLTDDYQRIVSRCAHGKKIPVIQLLDEALKEREVAAIMARSTARPGLVEAVRDMIRQAEASIMIDAGQLVLVTPRRRCVLIDDTRPSSMPDRNDLLSQLARTWATRGRGLATPVFDSDGKAPAQVGWGGGLAHALVNSAYLLDRDVRDLEDLRSLPAVEGSIAPIVLIGIAAVAVAFVLSLIAGCIEDDNPELAALLRGIAMILSVVGIIALAKGGVPVYACGDDPETGLRRCRRV
jgi:hypothetical protein